MSLGNLPLNYWQLQTFMYELVRQCKFCNISTGHFNEALQHLHHDHEFRPNSLYEISVQEALFCAVQGVLTTGAMYSRILWPTKNDEGQDWRSVRGRALRLALDISPSEENAIRSRAVRDSFEHFDERLDEWLTDGKSRSVVDFAISDGPVERAFNLAGQSPERSFMRVLRIDNLKVSILGNEVDTKALHDAITDIGERADAWLKSKSERP